MRDVNTYTIAKQITYCRNVCKGNCRQCKKLPVINDAFKTLTPVEQLEVDNMVFELESTMSTINNEQRVQRNIRPRLSIGDIVMLTSGILVLYIMVKIIGG